MTLVFVGLCATSGWLLLTSRWNTAASPAFSVNQSTSVRIGFQTGSRLRLTSIFESVSLRWLLSAVCLAALLSTKNPWLFPILAPIAIGITVILTMRGHKRRSAKKREAVAAELPVVIELLALATSAGEAPAAALRRVALASHGHIGRAMSTAVDSMARGGTLVQTLEHVKREVGDLYVDRSLDTIILGYERGTSLGEVLHAQALDVREHYRRSLIEFSSRAEIAMMVPVVFLIMPVTILFALFPSIQALTTPA